MRILVNGDGVMSKILCDVIKDTCDTLEYDNYDIIIDFSHPDQLDIIEKLALTRSCPVLIATTGYNEEQLLRIQKLATKVPILHVKNTSYGFNILNKISVIIKQLVPKSDIEIIDKHHRNKVDSPSGSTQLLIDSLSDVIVVNGRSGQCGPRNESELGVHSVRTGNITGEHTVIFGFGDELLEIKHSALSKKVFAQGALSYARLLIKQNHSRLYTTEYLLGGN